LTYGITSERPMVVKDSPTSSSLAGDALEANCWLGLDALAGHEPRSRRRRHLGRLERCEQISGSAADCEKPLARCDTEAEDLFHEPLVCGVPATPAILGVGERYRMRQQIRVLSLTLRIFWPNGIVGLSASS
jgi:hypothetical protein